MYDHFCYNVQVRYALGYRDLSEGHFELRTMYNWELGTDGEPQRVTCPNGQQAEVKAGRKEHRYCATFEAADCDGCSFCDSCRTLPLKRRPDRVLRFSRQDLEVALRRQRMADARASRQNLRTAVEATVRSIKHPFGNGKVPVRGQPRVAIIMLESAAMSNARHIHRYLVGREEAKRAKKSDEKEVRQGQPILGSSLLVSFWAQLRSSLRPISRLMHSLQPSPGYGA